MLLYVGARMEDPSVPNIFAEESSSSSVSAHSMKEATKVDLNAATMARMGMQTKESK